MRKSFTLLLAAWLTLGFSQDRYTAGMQKAMELWSADQPIEAANLFERISKAEPEQWLPPYYVALIYATRAFGEEDEVALTEGLNKATDFIDMAESISPDNPEILVVRAMINTAWIAFDGRRYGMTLSPANNQLYQKAIELAPNNPRVVFSKADWEMGSARYFGKDTTPYCGAVKRSLELFGEFSSDIPFYPKWGEPRARQVAARCE